MTCAPFCVVQGVSNEQPFVFLPSCQSNWWHCGGIVAGCDVLQQKQGALRKLCAAVAFYQAVVFCNQLAVAETVTADLNAAGYPAAFLSGVCAICNPPLVTGAVLPVTSWYMLQIRGAMWLWGPSPSSLNLSPACTLCCIPYILHCLIGQSVGA